MSPDVIVNAISKVLPDVEERLTVRESQQTAFRLYVEIPPERLKDVVEAMAGIEIPHFSAISGDDLGDSIELSYHFAMGCQDNRGEVVTVLRMKLPKDNLKLQSLTDLLPGTMTAEREAREFWGVEFEGLPDKRHIFLPEDFPEDVHPWRKDEKGLKGMIGDETGDQ